MALSVTGTGVTIGNGLGPIGSNSDSRFRLILETSTVSNNSTSVLVNIYLQTYDAGAVNDPSYTWSDSSTTLTISGLGETVTNNISIDTTGKSCTIGGKTYVTCQMIYSNTVQLNSGDTTITATFNRGAGNTGSSLSPTVTQKITVTGVQTAPTNLQLIDNGDNTYTPTATLGNNSTGIHFYYYFGDGVNPINGEHNHIGVSVAGNDGVGEPIPIYQGVKKVFIRAWTIPNEQGLWSTRLYDIEYEQKQPTFNVTQEGKNIRVTWVSGEHFDCVQLSIYVSVDGGTAVDYYPDYHKSNSFEFVPEGATNNSKIVVTCRFRYDDYYYNEDLQKMELTGPRDEDYYQTIIYKSDSLQVYVCKGNNWVRGNMYVCKSNSWKTPTQIKVCKNSGWK